LSPSEGLRQHGTFNIIYKFTYPEVRDAFLPGALKKDKKENMFSKSLQFPYAYEAKF